MKAIFKLKFLFALFLISLTFTKCTSGKYIGNEQYLLSKNTITEAGLKIKNKELYSLLKKQPNKKILGIAPLYLAFYNLSSQKNEDNYLKKIGEAPVLLNYRLARKSASQIEIYYKNKGYLDAKVSFNITTRKHKAKAIYDINSGDKYKIGIININFTEDEKLKKILDKLIIN